MRRALGLLLSTVLLGGCNDATEGERLGVYSVIATRTQDTCGSQMSGKVQRAQFNVVLSLRQGVLQWTPAGANAASGTYNVFQGTFRIAAEASTQMIAPDRRREFPGCVLRRVDVIDGAVTSSGDAGAMSNVDAGTVLTGFQAQETIAYGTESGDCSPLIGVGGGQAFALPCVVGYRMEATRVGP